MTLQNEEHVWISLRFIYRSLNMKGSQLLFEAIRFMGHVLIVRSTLSKVNDQNLEDTANTN